MACILQETDSCETESDTMGSPCSPHEFSPPCIHLVSSSAPTAEQERALTFRVVREPLTRLLSLAPSQDVLRPVDLFPPSEIRGEVSSCLSLQGLLPQIYRSLRCCESEVNLWRPRSACWRKSRSELDCLFSQITAPLGGF